MILKSIREFYLKSTPGLLKIIDEYKQKTRKSSKLYDKARCLLPGGVSSPARFYLPYPFYVERAKDSYLWDVDGNRYIDYNLAFGAIIAGHANERIVERVKEQVERDTLYGAPNEYMILLAEELVRRYPMVDMFRFTNSGTEAIMSAIRLARACTGRDGIIKVEGCYHGHFDDVFVSIHPPYEKTGPRRSPNVVVESAGIPSESVVNTLVAPYNDIEIMDKLLESYGDGIAAIVLEPVICNSGVILPRDNYLRELRKLTLEYNVLLIFDEVKTGCRIAPGGACEYFGVNPDIVVLGKVIGGGLPLAAFGAREELMNMIMPMGPVAHFGTYTANPVSAVAGLTCLKEVMTPDAYYDLERISKALFEGLRDVASDTGVEAKIPYIGSIGSILFGDVELLDYRSVSMCDKLMWHKFWLSMAVRGVVIAGSSWYSNTFLSIKHTKEDVEETIEKAGEVMRILKSRDA